MKRLTFTVTCDVCGCDGEIQGTPYVDKNKDYIQHIDPKVCEKNIKLKKNNDKTKKR